MLKRENKTSYDICLIINTQLTLFIFINIHTHISYLYCHSLHMHIRKHKYFCCFVMLREGIKCG